MARLSAAAQSITVIGGSLGQRPQPPGDLTETQATIWRDTVDSESADFFRTDALRELLKDYCRHKATAAVLASAIEAFQPEWLMDEDGLRRFDRLTMVRDRETKAAGDKATKLRLTNQSRYTPQAAGTAAKNASVQQKPWQKSEPGAA